MKIVKLSFEEACALTGHDPVQSLPYHTPTDSVQEGYNALRRLDILTEAYNLEDGKKFEPDYGNDDEKKWFPYFEFDPAARVFRFDGADHVFTIAGAGSGSRHVSRTRDIAVFIGTEHIDEWNKWLLK